MIASVTKLLDRNQTRGNLEASAAIKAEGRALADAGTWLESSVMKQHELVSKATHSRIKIHMGELLSICSIKHVERAATFQIHKGRVCFRGDCANDEQLRLAVYQ